jgi:hypothetical protein
MPFEARGYLLLNGGILGTDGWIRVWDFGNLTPIEENNKTLCRQESLIYFTIGSESNLLSKVDLPSAPNDLIWVLQVHFFICIMKL